MAPEDDVRERLQDLRLAATSRARALDADVADVVEARRDGNVDDEHDPEGATIAVDRAQAAGLAADARRQVDEIDAALDRLASGRYGVCERCGAVVGAERLEARPTARRCVACQRHHDGASRLDGG